MVETVWVHRKTTWWLTFIEPPARHQGPIYACVSFWTMECDKKTVNVSRTPCPIFREMREDVSEAGAPMYLLFIYWWKYFIVLSIISFILLKAIFYGDFWILSNFSGSGLNNGITKILYCKCHRFWTAKFHGSKNKAQSLARSVSSIRIYQPAELEKKTFNKIHSRFPAQATEKSSDFLIETVLSPAFHCKIPCVIEWVKKIKCMSWRIEMHATGWGLMTWRNQSVSRFCWFFFFFCLSHVLWQGND